MIKKRLIKSILFSTILLFFNTYVTTSSPLIPVIEKITGQALWDQAKHFGVGQEREQLLHEVSQEITELEDTDTTFTQQIEGQLAEVQGELNTTKLKNDQNIDDDMLVKELSVLNETYQQIKETTRIREQIRTLLIKFTKLLTSFFQDPEFNTYKKEHKLTDRLYYSFHDLEKIHEKILEQTKHITYLAEQEKNARIELENHKRLVTIAQDEYKKIQEKLVAANTTQLSLPHQRHLGNDYSEQKKLLTLEERLLNIKKNNYTLQSKEFKRRIESIAFQLFIAKSELDLLKQYLQKIKPSVRVSEADIVHEKDEFNKWKLEYYKKRDQLQRSLEEINEQLKNKEELLGSLSKKYNIPISSELTKWSKEPVKTIKGYVNFLSVASNNTAYLLLENEKELQEAHNALEDELLTYKSVQIQVAESYQKISSRKLASDDELTKEVRSYERLLADARTKEIKYKEKTTQVGDLISTKKTILDNINHLKTQIQRAQDTLFKNNTNDFNHCMEMIKKSEQLVQKQIDILSSFSGIYSSVLLHNNNTQRLISFIKGELETITIWRRSEHAINWQGITDTVFFTSDIHNYITHFNIKIVLKQLMNAFSSPLGTIIIIIKLLLALLFLLFCNKNLSYLIGKLLLFGHIHTGFITYITMIATCILSFLKAYFWWFGLWFITYIFFIIMPYIDPYLCAIFFIASIPYFLFFSRLFMVYLIQFNTMHNYLFFSKAFKHRCSIVLSIILYSTITLVFFRHAFLLVSYYKSELPTILIAINSIIISLSPIFLITREQLVGYVSNDDRIGRWLKVKINANYYFLIIIAGAIIIMINPYVGFGHLVSHILFNILYTCGLILSLLWAYTTFKSIMSRVFFFTEQDVTRERFINAKVWFGLIIIATFILIVFLGILGTARIWGWQILIADIIGLLYEPLTGKGTTNPITVISLLQIITFVFGGFFISHGINGIVLDKIFDLLTIETGVQYAVTRITQYIIITIAVLIGFHSVGLGELIVIVLGAVALSLGWVLKEPVSDFASYFMILIQRPVKIGDYIELDEEIRGVVRKITPRTVLLRKKNSTMIVVPNSIVTSKAINNWNYTRNFTAFNDINLVISYNEDPVLVKKLLHKAVDSHPNVLKNPPSVVRLDNFGENGYEFMVRGHISPVYTLEQWNIASDVRLAIVRLLREHNITIAVPVRILKEDTSTIIKKNSNS